MSGAYTVAESVDINVSPDKRSIFLHSEGQLVETLKVSYRTLAISLAVSKADTASRAHSRTFSNPPAHRLRSRARRKR